MTDLRPVLERLRDRIPAPPGGLERLIRYRERKRRRQRLATIGIALILGVAGTLVAVRALAPQGRSNPASVLPHGAISFVRGTLAGTPIRDAEIYLMQPDGSGVRKLTDAAADGKVAAEPAWSPDGTRIAFVLSTPEHLGAYAGDGDLYVMSADGTGMTKLTDGLRDAHPAWSPDGTRILFVRDQGNSLLVMNADGSDATEIRPHGEAFPPYQWPAWSPDGTRIAFQASPSAGIDTNGVYVTDIDGNGTRVTLGSSDGYPAWSPDGSTLAYAGSDGIYLHDIQTGTDRRLTFCGKPENCGFDFEPSWAPDGSRIVFARQDYGGSSVQIFVVNADGTGVQQLTSGSEWNAEPVWQPVSVEGGGPSRGPSTSLPSPATPALADTEHGSPFDVAFGAGAVWALTCDSGCLGDRRDSTGSALRIDPDSGEVLASVSLRNPSRIAVGEGGVWVISFWDGTVTRIDPATSQVVATIELELPFAVCENCPGPRDFLPYDVAVGEGAVWIDTARGVLARIDPATNRVEDMIRLPAESPQDVAVGGGAVWVAMNLLGVYRIDSATDQVAARIVVDESPDRRLSVGQVVVGGGSVWVQGGWARKTTDSEGHEVYVSVPGAAIAKIDPFTDRSAALLPVGDTPRLMAFDGGALWLWSGGSSLERIDPTTGTETATVDAPAGGHFVTVGDSAAWVVVPDGSLKKVDLPTG